MSRSSRLPGFYRLSRTERIEKLIEASALDPDQASLFDLPGGLSYEQAEHMIENVVGTFALPLGIATNFVINGREVLIPMAVEEPSIVAGASYMAKLARQGGGFEASTTEPEMIGQIQVLDLSDPHAAVESLTTRRSELLEIANTADPLLVELGGGARELEFRIFEDTPAGPMLVVHLIFDTRDAMGANAINTALERMGPDIERLTAGRVHLRILSNLADRRLARATCRIPADAFAAEDTDGETIIRGVAEAWAFAAVDPYRAATHNKGIMNGIDAVAVATGNDWRAIEAGAHAYAARGDRYTALSRWQVNDDSQLEGSLELPLAVGTVGGATRVHPLAQANLRLMDISSARELAEIIAAVGLAQNLAALRALATEGIQRGHMALHARQVAITAGAQAGDIDRIAQLMVAADRINVAFARQLLGGHEPTEDR
ncbi:MAG: hydroxymethylglutaryl-CoA reductase, degradative [Anaerolineales bacterium]|nr:hydroxymethylglutaryl-CoA reductase, degradative [Anaerolineales bacterium]